MLPMSTRGARLARAAASALLLGAFAPGRALAQATGDVPYAVLYETLAPAVAIRRYPRLLPVQRVESKLDGVAPDSIRIRIGAGADAIDVPVGADGAIDFPLQAALLAANPPVRTNQPRGSLTLSVTLALRVPAGPRLAADAIRAALAEVDALMAETAGGAPRARGVEFRFPAGAGASLNLSGAGGRVLVADARDRIVLMRDTDLQPPAALLEFSTAPVLVLPWMGR